jgi:hypothetical protein
MFGTPVPDLPYVRLFIDKLPILPLIPHGVICKANVDLTYTQPGKEPTLVELQGIRKLRSAWLRDPWAQAAVCVVLGSLLRSPI